MELLSVLRLLAAKRLLVALGAVAAVIVGLVASGALGIGPMSAAELTSAVASSRTLIDTPRPLAADLGASDVTIDAQAVLLAESLADAAPRAALARRAGVPARELSVLSAGIEESVRSPLATAAEEAGQTPSGAYTLNVRAPPDVPIITVVAAAPDRLTAARLAAAAPPVLESLAASRAPTQSRRLSAERLGPVHVAEVTSGGMKPLIGIVGGVALLAMWCCGIVILSGLARTWRRLTGDIAAAGRPDRAPDRPPVPAPLKLR